MIYDTLKLSKALRVSFTPEQADTLAQAFSESTEDSVATKLDIAELKGEIAGLRTELRTEIAGVRGEIADLRAELRTEIAGVRGEIADLRAEFRTEIAGVRGEIADLRAELRTEIASVRTEISGLKVDMVRWIVGAIVFNLLGTLGLMITVSELVLKTR